MSLRVDGSTGNEGVELPVFQGGRRADVSQIPQAVTGGSASLKERIVEAVRRILSLLSGKRQTENKDARCCAWINEDINNIERYDVGRMLQRLMKIAKEIQNVALRDEMIKRLKEVAVCKYGDYKIVKEETGIDIAERKNVALVKELFQAAKEGDIAKAEEVFQKLPKDDKSRFYFELACGVAIRYCRFAFATHFMSYINERIGIDAAERQQVPLIKELFQAAKEGNIERAEEVFQKLPKDKRGRFYFELACRIAIRHGNFDFSKNFVGLGDTVSMTYQEMERRDLYSAEQKENMESLLNEFLRPYRQRRG